MAKKLAKPVLFSLLVAMLFLCGCWDARDIEERDIATLAILDKTEDGYRFFVEFADTSSGGTQGSVGAQGSGGGKYVYHAGEGKNFVEARAALDTKANNPLYLGAVNALVVTERMAYYGIKEYLYRLRDINDYRKVVHIFVTDCEPEQFAAVGKGETSAGEAIVDTMHTLVNAGQMCERSNLGFVLEAFASPCKSFLLPHVSIQEGDVIVAGFCVFSDGVCVGRIAQQDSWGMQFLNQEKVDRYYTAPAGDVQATARLTLKKKKIEPSYENGRIGFLIRVEFDAVLAYISEDIDFGDALAEEFARNLEYEIANDIARAVYESQKVYGLDYMSFCVPFRIKYPVEYRQMDWHGAFPDADFTIEVGVELHIKGVADYIPKYEF